MDNAIEDLYNSLCKKYWAKEYESCKHMVDNPNEVWLLISRPSDLMKLALIDSINKLSVNIQKLIGFK